MKKQLIALVAAGALALLGIGAVVLYAQGAEERALEGTETVEVLQATEDIALKTPVDEVEDKVEVVKIPKAVALEGAVDSLDDLAGQVTSVAFVAGDQLSTSKFAMPDDVKGAVAIPDGLQELTIEIGGERFVGGTPNAGDEVGVFSSFALTDGTKITGNPINRLLVLKVAASAVPEEGAAPTLITLAVTTKQAEQIIHTKEFGTIWLTLQNEDTDTSGGDTITYQDVTP